MFRYLILIPISIRPSSNLNIFLQIIYKLQLLLNFINCYTPDIYMYSAFYRLHPAHISEFWFVVLSYDESIRNDNSTHVLCLKLRV